jgi:sucrose phosphorylase
VVPARQPEATWRRLADHLNFLYGAEGAGPLLDSLERRLLAHSLRPPPTAGPLGAGDAVLITYADQLRGPDAVPLQVLRQFLAARVTGLISGIHLLPFYPSSSDDGFSVIDYRQVDPAFGSWQQVHALAEDFRLMVDAVINHVSARSEWFQAFQRGDNPYANFFLTMDPLTDLSRVIRPRDLPLLTEVDTSGGPRHLWTTFSADQFDLNFANPQVLLEVLDLLLFYVGQGAQFIRLDAIAFLWKQVGSTCLHLPQTHEVVRLMRTLLEIAAPWVMLITETNVPHAENLSYFGDGSDEAHQVYQFALPPLVLHTLTTGSSYRLTRWAAELRLPGERVTFFNFLASHDGIGLRPVSGILEEAELQKLIGLAEARGGGTSYRRGLDDAASPYELNINYLDALSPTGELEADPSRSAARFLLAQAIMLSLQGLPGIYFHSLVGSRGDRQGAERSGRLRSINRQKLDAGDLSAGLADPRSLRSLIFRGYAHLLKARRSHPGFSPGAGQQVLDLGPGVFGLLRHDPGSGRRVLCVHEVAGQAGAWSLQAIAGRGFDLLRRGQVELDGVHLAPYQARWIDLDPDGPA